MNLFSHHETIIVVDFETTGMYPDKGDRVIEIGAVKLSGQQVVDRFEALINPGFLITREIENITGINNQMLVDAPGAEKVFGEFLSFISSYPLVAHNASFDQKFLESEINLLGRPRPLNFGCTLQVAKRIYPDVINYKLETLIRYKKIPVNGQFHRASADAEMTAALWVAMLEDIRKEFGYESVSFDLIKKFIKTPKEQAAQFLRQEAENSQNSPLGETGSLF